MRNAILGAILIAIPLILLAVVRLSQAYPSLDVGQPAPDISVMGTDGKKHNLREMVGKSWLVVSWFPKAFTGG